MKKVVLVNVFLCLLLKGVPVYTYIMNCFGHLLLYISFGNELVHTKLMKLYFLRPLF